MYLLAVALGILLVQTGCVIHALHRGYSHSFVMLVLLVPLVGAIGYLIVEFAPRLYEAHVRKTLMHFQRPNPYQLLQAKLHAANEKPTIENKHALAKAYLELHEHEQALQLLDSLLKNQFSHDPFLLQDKAKALFGLEKFHEAKFVLEILFKHRSIHSSDAEGHLLYARTLAALGEFQQANYEFERLHHYYTGLAASYYYLRHLRQLNHETRAEEVLRHMQKRLKRLPKHYRGKESAWLKQAQKEN